MPSRIETGRWYDLKVEVQGRHVTCYLDGKVMHRVTREALIYVRRHGRADRRRATS